MNPDGEIVQSLGRILAVEVASGDGLAALSKHDGVISGAVDLCRDDPPDELNGVMSDAVNLRGAAQSVGIL